jgi:hypothetical protein
MSRNGAETDRLCMEYQHRLTTLGAGARSLHSGLPYEPEDGVEAAPPAPPGRRPPWGPLKVAIFAEGKQLMPGDGPARAARREKAWYPF